MTTFCAYPIDNSMLAWYMGMFQNTGLGWDILSRPKPRYYIGGRRDM